MFLTGRVSVVKKTANTGKEKEAATQWPRVVHWRYALLKRHTHTHSGHRSNSHQQLTYRHEGWQISILDFMHLLTKTWNIKCHISCNSHHLSIIIDNKMSLWQTRITFWGSLHFLILPVVELGRSWCNKGHWKHSQEGDNIPSQAQLQPLRSTFTCKHVEGTTKYQF